jgi:hypothetical protein
MKKNRLFQLAFLMAAASWPHLAMAKNPQPSVVVDLQKNQVTAAGLTPGADVLVFGYGAATTGYDRMFVEWHELVTDDDHDGAITFTSKRHIPWRSIWVVVDLRNAQFAVGAPDAYQIATPNHRRVFSHDAAGLLDQTTSMAPWLSAVYVHPGGGVWLLSATDGQPTDADGRRDGLTTVALPSFTALTPAADRPKEFVPGGVLILLDPFHMRLDAVQLDGSVLNNGGAR